MIEKSTCANCAFFDRSRNAVQGICRRFPPCFLGVSGLATFPIVGHGLWCGEWKDREARIYEIQKQDS
jgi:hypothetical protein